MTNDFFEQLKRAKDAVRFAPERKKAVRDYLVRMTAADVVLRAPRKEHHAFGSFFMRPMPMLAGIAALVLIGGGTSFAAQGTLPGDLLYPVKVSVTEKVLGAVQLTPDAQAEYAAELATRRLDEAAKLAERGSIPDELEEEIVERFAEQASRANTALTAVRTKDVERAARIAAVFEAAMRVRGRALGAEDDVDDASAGAMLMAALPAPETAGGSADEPQAPMLMAAPADLQSIATGSPSEIAVPTGTEAVPPSVMKEEKSGRDGSAAAKARRSLKTRVRDALREIRAFREQAESEIPGLRERSENGDVKGVGVDVGQEERGGDDDRGGGVHGEDERGPELEEERRGGADALDEKEAD
jgi:hypothetical protein